MTHDSLALICGKWQMPFYIPLESEEGVPERSRSYAHFVTERPDLVAAKCLATEWVVEGSDTGGLVVEFFGGVGLVSVILRHMLQPDEHRVLELDERCVYQLNGLLERASVRLGDARDAMLEPGAVPEGAFVSLDFPHFSVLDLRPGKRWAQQVPAVFAGRPRAVVLTETTVSYFHVHRVRYGEFFGTELEGPEDYVRALSRLLYERFRYSVSRAALRGRNAYYLCCRPGLHEPVFKEFALEQSASGFRWLEGGPEQEPPAQPDLFGG